MDLRLLVPRVEQGRLPARLLDVHHALHLPGAPQVHKLPAARCQSRRAQRTRDGGAGPGVRRAAGALGARGKK